jgi:hypothetical protein
MFVGRMDQATLQDDGETAQINIAAESRLIDLQRARVRRYTDEDQRAVYPSDKGLSLINQLQDKEIVW